MMALRKDLILRSPRSGRLEGHAIGLQLSHLGDGITKAAKSI